MTTRDEWEIEIRPDTRLGAAHVGNRVHAVHRGGGEPRIPLEVTRGIGRVQPVHREADRGFPLDLDLEALPLGSEGPRWVEVTFAHEPVDPRGDDGLAAEGTVP